MGLPYAFIRVFEDKDPTLDKSDRNPKQQTRFLLKNGNMKGQYLGACLDSCRWGSTMTVMYEMDVNEMISFIQNWMKQNKDNFRGLYHEKKIEELYKKFELPHIHHEKCPRDENHRGILRDLDGKLRCSASKEQKLKPSYVQTYEIFDEESQTTKKTYYEEKPFCLVPDDEWDEPSLDEEVKKYQAEMEKYEQEEENFVVKDTCHAIISDKDYVLPLETVIKRLNISPKNRMIRCDKCSPEELKKIPKESREMCEDRGFCLSHPVPNNELVFCFDGWDLAFYVQKWYQQVPDGNASLFAPEGF